MCYKEKTIRINKNMAATLILFNIKNGNIISLIRINEKESATPL